MNQNPVAVCTPVLWEMRNAHDFVFTFPAEGKQLEFNRAAMVGSEWFRNAESFFYKSNRTGKFSTLSFDNVVGITFSTIENIVHLRYGLVTLKDLLRNKDISFSDLYFGSDFLMDQNLKYHIFETIKSADHYEGTVELFCCAFDLSKDELDTEVVDYCLDWLVRMNKERPLESCEEYISWCCDLETKQLKRLSDMYREKMEFYKKKM